VCRALADPASFRHAVFEAYRRMVRRRCRQSAFSPAAEMAVLDMGPQVFAIRRSSETQRIWALTNVSARQCRVRLRGVGDELVDLVDGFRVPPEDITLGPYQYRWLTAADSRGGAALS